MQSASRVRDRRIPYSITPHDLSIIKKQHRSLLRRFIHDMAQSREVLAVMDPHTTTFGRKRSCTTSRCNAVLMGSVFLLCHFAPYLGSKAVRTVGEFNDSVDLLSARRSKIHFRLPRSIIPDSYELSLIPFIWKGNFTFHGEVKILVNVTEQTKNINLRANILFINKKLTSVSEYSIGANITKCIEIDEQLNDFVREIHVIRTSEPLIAGKQYIIYLNYVGYLDDNSQGFFRSSYSNGNNQTRWIAATHFEPIAARTAFPCFDEPALKATFQISIARPDNMTSLSNMPRRGQSQPVSGLPNHVWDHYEQSVPMSTYLVAFVVTDFEVLRSGNFAVWARSEAIEQARYSLDIGPKILKHYEDYFQIKFPLPKIDMVAIPDFLQGAMENWGLITYRESAMLFQNGVSPSRQQQLVAHIVAHELAHQWFGNLVTPSWWTDIWLNEGFARYVQYIGLHLIEPEWKVFESFVVDVLQNVLVLDALESVDPVSIEVSAPREILARLNPITYNKGASLIRMMDHFLTTEVFKHGVMNYLNGKVYQSAQQDDLWDALTKQAFKDGVLSRDVTVKQIMDTWTLQAGFPVITVTRDYDMGGASLMQNRFTIRKSTAETFPKSEPLWWVPITYTTEADKDFNRTQPSDWLKAERSMTLSNISASRSQWVIFNVQQTGYYRVNYDNENWQLIIRQLKLPSFKDIPTLNRGQLVNDALNLARAERLDYATALSLTCYLTQETEYVPWKAAVTAMSYLDSMLNTYQGYDRFRMHVSKLLGTVYTQIGFTDNPHDSQSTNYTRSDIVYWACYFGNDDCVRKAVKAFENWRNSPNPDNDNPIPPNLKRTVYSTAIRVGGRAEWDFAWQRYLHCNASSDQELLLSALACTRETSILNQYLEWAATENSGIRNGDSFYVFVAVCENSIGKSLVFSFIKNNWDLLKRLSSLSRAPLGLVIKSVTNMMSTKSERNDLLKFIEGHVEVFDPAFPMAQQALEQAENNIRWYNRNYKTIRDWLYKNTA